MVLLFNNSFLIPLSLPIYWTDWNDNCWNRAWSKYQLWLESNSRKWQGYGATIWTRLYRTHKSWKQVHLSSKTILVPACYFPIVCFVSLILVICSCYLAATMQVVFSTRSFYSRLAYTVPYWLYFKNDIAAWGLTLLFQFYFSPLDWYFLCFSVRYFTDQPLKRAFDTALADPTVDLNMQL